MLGQRPETRCQAFLHGDLLTQPGKGEVNDLQRLCDSC